MNATEARKVAQGAKSSKEMDEFNGVMSQIAHYSKGGKFQYSAFGFLSREVSGKLVSMGYRVREVSEGQKTATIIEW